MRSLVPARWTCGAEARQSTWRTHLRTRPSGSTMQRRPRQGSYRGSRKSLRRTTPPATLRPARRKLAITRGSLQGTHSQSRSRDRGRSRGRDRQSAPSRVAASSAWGRTAGSVPSAFGAGRIRGHLPGNLAVFGNRHGNRHGSRHGTRHGTRHGALKEDRAECRGRISRAGDPIVIVPRAHTKNAARTACSHHTNVEARPAVPQEMR